MGKVFQSLGLGVFACKLFDSGWLRVKYCIHSGYRLVRPSTLPIPGLKSEGPACAGLGVFWVYFQFSWLDGVTMPGFGNIYRQCL
jgi:hypothetical protein